jgi:ribonuclease HI
MLFVPQMGEAGVGVVARDSDNRIILTAWRVLFRSQDAVEAEAQACLEGFRLAAQWIQGPIILESDCARIVQGMQQQEDRSAHRFVLEEAKDQTQLLVDWQIVTTHKLKAQDKNLKHHHEHHPSTKEHHMH